MGTLAGGLGCFPLVREAYPPRTDCCDSVAGIRSLIRAGRRKAPRSRSVLYPQQLRRNASPKAISRRTSYLQVRLVFCSDPQLIPEFFNIHGFGPPRAVKPASAWPWIDHLPSRLIRVTWFAHFALAFASDSGLRPLTLLRTSTRRSIMQKVRRHPCPCGHRAPTVCRCLVSGAISLPSPGCFSFFAHATRSLSVVEEYLALEGGPSSFKPGFPCLALLGKTIGSPMTFAYGAITRCGGTFQDLRLATGFLTAASSCNSRARLPQPRLQNARRLTGSRFGQSFPFARRY